VTAAGGGPDAVLAETLFEEMGDDGGEHGPRPGDRG
jgi:hypothetical protein